MYLGWHVDKFIESSWTFENPVDLEEKNRCHLTLTWIFFEYLSMEEEKDEN